MAKLSKKLFDALNEQIEKEISSAYLYLSMSTYCDSQNLKGSAQWLRMQWDEELTHAMKILDYIGDRGNRALLQAVGEPGSDFKSLLDVFEKVLEHEQKVSEMINNLYGMAVAEKDFAAQAFLQWFVSEQVEEESTASEIVENLRMAGDKGSALLMIDRQLGSRSNEDSGE